MGSTHIIDELDQEQIGELKQVFNLFDKDKNGEITRTEMRQAMIAMNCEASDEKIVRMLQLIDKDGNGMINFSEFLHVMGNLLYNSSRHSAMKEVFKMFDRDRNGNIDPEEIREMGARLGIVLSTSETNEIMHLADANGDGFLNYDEFMTLMIDKRDVERARRHRPGSRGHSRLSESSYW